MTAKRFALQKLSRRSYLTHEMEALMAEKGYSSQEITPVIDELKGYGYLNDREWAEQAIRREIRAKHGPLRIRQKMNYLGVDSAVTAELLEEHYPEELRLETISSLLDKKSNKDQKKVIASISRLGFSIQEILKVCYNKNKG